MTNSLYILPGVSKLIVFCVPEAVARACGLTSITAEDEQRLWLYQQSQKYKAQA